MPRKHVRPVQMIAYSPAKAAAACSVRPERISTAIRDGSLQAFRVGTKTLILRTSLESWVACHPPSLRGKRHAV